MNNQNKLKVGNSQTGKTSFINRLDSNTFSDNVASTIRAQTIKIIIYLCHFGTHPVKSDFVL